MISYGFGGAHPQRHGPRSWSHLRALRHRPPGRANRGMRKAEFDAALEQGEQLLYAAGTVGPATSPILLFYGIAQLGRAISAASTNLNNDQFQSSGHGLVVKSMDGVADRGVSTLQIVGLQNQGSHAVMARALNACPLTREVDLGALWALLDLDGLPLPGAQTKHPQLELRSVGGWIQGSNSYDYWPVVEAVLPSAETRHPTAEYSEPELTAELRTTYPQLVAHRMSDDAPDRSFRQESLRGELISHDPVMRFDVTEGKSFADVCREAAAVLGGVAYVHPDLCDCGKQTHPFLLWWEILYALSRLARYKPREWTHLIDVSRHSNAAPIEAALRASAIWMPELALSALGRAVAPEGAGVSAA